MSEKLEDLAPFLITLQRLKKPSQRRALLATLDRQQLKAIEEVALNIVKNTTHLTPEEIRVCQRWKQPIKLLALSRYPVREKKAILLQQGGFLPAILPILASVITSAIASRF